MTAALPLWAVIMLAVLSSTVIAGVIGFIGIRYQVRANRAKVDADTYATGAGAQNDTIDRLSKENERLAKRAGEQEIKIDAQETRIDELERHVRALDLKDRALLQHADLTSHFIEEHWRREHPDETPSAPIFQYIEMPGI